MTQPNQTSRRVGGSKPSRASRTSHTSHHGCSTDMQSHAAKLATSSRTERRHGRGRRRDAQRRTEGVVLLVVMFVLAISTAAGSLAVVSGRQQLRAAGKNRLRVQGGALAEAIVSDALIHWTSEPPQTGNFPMFQDFGEPDAPVGAGGAFFVDEPLLDGSRPIGNVPVWSPSDALDPTGTLGPNAQWTPTNAAAAGLRETVVVLQDCFNRESPPGTAAASGGSAAGGGGGGGQPPVAQICLARAHARLQAPGAVPRQTWAVPGQLGVYRQFGNTIDRTAVGAVTITITP